MTPPLTPRSNCPMETPTATEIMPTQLFGVRYITLTGTIDSMAPNSGPWSLLGKSISYILKLAPILWWALPLAQLYPVLSCLMPLPIPDFLTLIPFYYCVVRGLGFSWKELGVSLYNQSSPINI
ncbi:hypothetical protein DSO57_1026582 [Entomophthora muscae]|uniref:Uncharacterized protein n=1 Tax=Entomophthora muscae TaxID=34485 RepID=A0ACC2RGP8_9FUNG|nr:hypothetical protein DSO57_1026582 [Entomophthora muscae]